MFKAPTIIKKEEPKFSGSEARDVSNLLALLDDYDKKMLGYIIELHNASGRDIINIDKFENVIQALQHINAENEYDYLNSLLHPEMCKGVKIPSPIPVPSCAFQLHNTVTLSTNSSGNLVFLFNPFFLYNDSLNGVVFNPSTSDPSIAFTLNFASSFYFNNNDNVDGRTAGVAGWNNINIGQGIPNVYNQYRLVSASLVVRYIGRMDITSGVIGGAIIYDESVIPSVNVRNNAGGDSGIGSLNVEQTLYKYSNFDLAMDSFYHQETNCIKGLREIYFPLDNTYEEYTKTIGSLNEMKIMEPLGVLDNRRGFTGLCKTGFQKMVYVLGAPPNSSCFKVDIYCNFETLPNASFLNYMPVSLTQKNVSPEVKKQSIAIVQKTPITDLVTKQKWYGGSKGDSIFGGLKRIWKSGIPKKAISYLAPYIMPYFKPAVSLLNLMGNSFMGNVDNSFQSVNPNVKQLINNAEEDDGNPSMIVDNVE